MKQSQLFYKTQKDSPKDAVTISHKLLLRGGFIEQIATGRYAFLPLGYLVWENIMNIIDNAIRGIGSQRVHTPTLQPIELWKKTNRDDAFGDEMTIIDDHHGATYALGATAEGLMTELVGGKVPSYKELPIVIHQLVVKFRDEKRPRGGLLRTREFMMKDAYSFHSDEEDLLKWYDKFKDTYHKIANIFDLDVVHVVADSGAIGGDHNHEFMVKSEVGEDVILTCADCNHSLNIEKSEGQKVGDVCKMCSTGKLEEQKTIEWAHIFHQGQFYSKPHNANFVDKDGSLKPLWQGAYGIGIGRTMGIIVETHFDDRGIIWPKSVTPYQVHLLNLKKDDGEANAVYETLQSNGFSVLYDDRDVGAGEKFAEADLIGISVRLVVSDKTDGNIEWKERAKNDVEVISASELINRLNDFYFS